LYFRVTALILLATVLFAAPAEDRPEDRAAIRAHIERIFRAFINHDQADIKATHDEHWLGFLTGSGSIIRGQDDYLRANGINPGATPPPKSPYGMSGYKLREFDMIFQGDAAFVTFVADTEYKGPGGTGKSVLRIADFYVKRNGQWIQAGSDTEVHPEALAQQNQSPHELSDSMKKQLLTAREAVWRAFFTNDRAALEKLIPDELITIETTGGQFGNRQIVLKGAEEFARSGLKLVRLEFPKTEIQSYGYTSIVYSTYLYELEKDGKRTAHSGRVTEVFVYRGGQWVNPGWHMDSTEARP
jgi:ketosteroid isomerase-like protein